MDVRAILDQYKAESLTKFHQGHEFERLMRAFFQTDPYYRNLFSQVWLWRDWPGRHGRPDCGIDLVAQQADSADVWAIQCKFYAEDHPVPKGDLDSFFTESGKHPFTERLIVATSPLSHHAEEAFVNQHIAVHTLTLDDLNMSRIDWSQFSWQSPQHLTLRAPKEPRPYQTRAIADVLEGFRTFDRGKLIMACGTGKTFTALQIAEKMVPDQGLVLVLMPSLALVSQTLQAWSAETRRPLRAYAVCSDTKVGQHDEDLRRSDLSFPATTDAATLTRVIQQGSGTDSTLTAIFSTYQSISVISEAQQQYGLPKFDLVICDEAHRTVGTAQKTAKGPTQSYFTMVHEEAFIRAHKRLYMTATPRIYAEDSKRRAEDNSVVLYSMDDEAVFGPTFHRLTFVYGQIKMDSLAIVFPQFGH